MSGDQDRHDDDGGPAFPMTETLVGSLGQEYQNQHFGLSLRDYFAAAALQGMFTAYKAETGADWKGHALDAYAVADAMLRARTKKDET